MLHFGTLVKRLAVIRENSAHGSGKGMLNHVSTFQASARFMCTNILLVKTKLGEGVHNESYSTPLGKCC